MECRFLTSKLSNSFSLLLNKGIFVGSNPIFNAYFLYELCYEGIWNVFYLFKTDAAFSHIEFGFGVFGVFAYKPIEEAWIGIYTHVV